MSGWREFRAILSAWRSIAWLAAVLIAAPMHGAAADPAGAVIRDPTLPQDAKGLDYEIGRALFERHWAAAPSSTQAADGLGPLFNAPSCDTCHRGGNRGVPYDAQGALLPALILKLGPHGASGAGPGDPVYGAQIQTSSVAGIGAEARASVNFESSKAMLGDGTVVELRKPIVRLENPAYGPLAPKTVISPRLAAAINGIGLLQRIPEAEILERADPDDRDGDGISGRPNRVTDPGTGKTALGRFGWKAGQASLEAQDARALDLDIGLSNPLFHDAYGDCTAAEKACLAMPNGASPQFENLEVPSSLTRLIDRFVAESVLPAPARPVTADIAPGQAVFLQSGCETCHRARFKLPAAGSLPARTIAPYTDLLLHDMGIGLADHMREGDASGREWRTAPLWGIGAALKAAPGPALLHDGRAHSIIEAVMWHDGEAAKARAHVADLPAADRQALIDFIGSL